MAIVDFIHESLALVDDTSLPGLRVMRELEAVIARRGSRRCASSTMAPN